MLPFKFVLGLLFCFFTLALRLSAQDLEVLTRVQDVKEVIVNNGNQVALAQLLLHSVQSTQPHQEPVMSKAHLEVKSYMGGVQLELVEAYFNINHGSYGPIANEFKTGRFALYPYENRYFRSEASADALLNFNLTSPNELFPYSPFNVGRKPEKHFRFWLADTLQIGENDTLLEIKFVPKKKDGTSFAGTAWLNLRTHELRQVLLRCQQCTQQPFTPLFHSDSIPNIDFQLFGSYGTQQEGAPFNKVKAIYEMSYLSRHHQDSSAIIYHGEASLQAFQIGKVFTSPQIYFEKEVPVYRKLMALPYAQKFWMANPEPMPNASIAKRNQVFYNQAAINNSLLQQRQIAYNRVYEHPYIPWSERRVLIREDLIGNAQKKSNQLSDISALYHLEAQLYYDIIQSTDTCVLMSSCILDPYLTYYNLSVDPAVNCFINMYFDLCEIARRKFEAKCLPVKLPHDQSQVVLIYEETKQALDLQLKDFLTQVDRGQNRRAMLKWNDFIKEELGIDNLAVFALDKK